MPQSERQNPFPGVRIQEDGPTIVFLTVATADRGRWLTTDENHRLIREVWQEADAWVIGHYLLMPDHLHLFCSPASAEFSIEQWIKFWKSRFSKRHQRREWTWQSRGWHHRMRTAESYAEKQHYMWQNPVRAGLVAKPEDWPCQGKLHDLIWRE